MVNENWYEGREPGGARDREDDYLDRVFPSGYVKIIRFLDSDAELGDFHERAPTPPLFPYDYKTRPSYLKCGIADGGSSHVSVIFAPTQAVIPGDPVRVEVTLTCITHSPGLRIVSVTLGVTVPGDEVKDLAPSPGNPLIKTVGTDVRRTDKTIRESSGGLVVGPVQFGEQEAGWSIKANSTGNIHGTILGQLSFTLGRQPREILSSCLVTAEMDNGQRITRRVESGASLWIRMGKSLPSFGGYFHQFFKY
ncbi:hypothetical protein EDB86DRAFT_2259294 [Lactarius hatsudake]|nr:hypothetical protein EDB86DRAFT_2259294 [Lactarius hatsudake]